jgi:hypothetical protein
MPVTVQIMSACSCCLWPSSAWVRALRGHGGWIRERLECGRVKVVSERGLGPSDEPEQHHVVWFQEHHEE